MQTVPDTAAVLRDVLSRALELTRDRQADHNGSFPFPSQRWSEAVRNTWIASLRDAFAERYRGSDNVAVFGGKPRGSEPILNGSPSGIREWHRCEFMYDVAVVEYQRIKAAYAATAAIPVVTRAIWLVESEMAGVAPSRLRTLASCRSADRLIICLLLDRLHSETLGHG